MIPGTAVPRVGWSTQGGWGMLRQRRWQHVMMGSVLSLAGIIAGTATGTEPSKATAAATTTATKPLLEVYHGTRNVTPKPPPPPSVPVKPDTRPVPAGTSKVGPRVSPTTEMTRAVVDTLGTLQQSVKEVTGATTTLLHKLGERPAQLPEPKPIILTNYIPVPAMTGPLSASATPWLEVNADPLPAPRRLPDTVRSGGHTEPAAAEEITGRSSSPPTVVVIREPAVPSPVIPAGEAGVTLGYGMLGGMLVAGLGVAIGLVGWFRRPTPAASAIPEPQPVTLVPAETPSTENGIKLLGKYFAGPVPDTAERFELGQTYQEELQQKKQVEVANNQAAMEMLLQQNLTLLRSFAEQGLSDGEVATPSAAADEAMKPNHGE